MPVPRSGAVRRHSGGTAYAGRNGRLRLRQCPVLSRPGNPGGLGMLHGGRNVALLRTPAFRRRFRHRFRISATGILVSSESDRRGPGQIPMVHAPRQVADAGCRSSGSRTSTCSKTGCASISMRRSFSPTTSPRHSSTNKVRRYLRSSPKVLGGENMISKWSATTGGGTVWRAAAVSPYW